MIIKLYSLDCPVCNIIKKLLDKKNIPYEYINDKETVIKVGEENNIENVPFAFIDNKLYETNELRKFINEQEEKK